MVKSNWILLFLLGPIIIAATIINLNVSDKTATRAAATINIILVGGLVALTLYERQQAERNRKRSVQPILNAYLAYGELTDGLTDYQKLELVVENVGNGAAFHGKLTCLASTQRRTESFVRLFPTTVYRYDVSDLMNLPNQSLQICIECQDIEGTTYGPICHLPRGGTIGRPSL